MLKLKEIRGKTDGDLKLLLETKKQSLWKFRLGVAGGKTRNVKEGREIRKDIAQLKTILNERKAENKNNE